MAKQTKKAKGAKPRSKPAVMSHIHPAAQSASPSHEDFKRARDLLCQRAGAIIMDLSKRYVASKAAELTSLLDAIDSVAEFERMHPPAAGVTVIPLVGPSDLGHPAPTVDSDAAGGKAAVATGTVKWFSLQKGFGFIVNTATGADVFVHVSAVEKAGLTKLNEGQQIEFEIEESRGKATAVNLKLK